MAFCKYSTLVKPNQSIKLNSIFITDYMPYAEENAVKVYLHGLYLCSNPEISLNTISDFASSLNLTEEQVENAFRFWKEQGLVNIIELDPIEVRFLDVERNKMSLTKFKEEKYSSFNKEAQELIEGRMITPTEFNEYYIFMESMHMTQGALIMTIKYCTLTKGTNVGYPYILTIAKNWAYEGVLTEEQVEQKLMELEKSTGDIKEVLLALGIRRNGHYDELQMLLKWTKEMGFEKDIILFVARSLKKKGGMERLDKTLTKYFNLKLFSEKEIADYELNKENLTSLAKLVNKKIGVYYENLDNVIETYITTWQAMGFDDQTILKIADFCFKSNIRSLEGMDIRVKKFHTLGLISLQSIEEYLFEVVATDGKIKNLLVICGLSRNVTSFDRDFYNTWTNQWKFVDEIIEYVCSLAHGKFQPMQYINKILSSYKEKGIYSLEKAKEESSKMNNVFEVKQNQTNFVGRSYSSEEISAMFDNLSEVKI